MWWLCDVHDHRVLLISNVLEHVMKRETALRKLARHGVPRAFAERYLELGREVTPLDVWNIHEDLRLERYMIRSWPGLASLAHWTVQREMRS